MNKSAAILSIFFALLASTQFYSCSCSCTCEKNLGCKILIAQQVSTGDTVAIKTFCSTTNFATDTVLADSVKAFYNRFQNANTKVTSRDSIYKFDSHDDLTCNQTKPYRENNYWCECAK